MKKKVDARRFFFAFFLYIWLRMGMDEAQA